MKLSYNWLKQYVDIDVNAEELSTILTDIGLEVEGLEKYQSIKGGLDGIVVGEVITCSRHPNADKLSVTTVDVGADRLLPIVCGAPNVAEGQKVLVATVGTTLYSDDDSFKIKKTKIRGEVSEGMICAEDELGMGTSHDGIIVLPDDYQAGLPAGKYFAVENDFVFEIGLTPNRADAASHIGTAKDLVAGLNRAKETRKYKQHLPSVDNFKVDDHSLDIDVVVEDTDACPRYAGVTITGVKVSESPDWLKNRLNAIGLRPLNNIVDVTNFVLHETGQPLHAFDADHIKGKVVVKKLPQDTAFVTLDEIERKLDANDLMICDTEHGMCIGGVFGGIHSGVTEKTTNIFLESAYFDPAHIRKSSRRHGLQTDASFRFERGVDPNNTLYALKRAILLFQEVAGGKVSSEIKDVYPKPIESWEVKVSYKNVDRLIGKSIPRDLIKEILGDLEIKVKTETEEGLTLLIPTSKVDVTREADVIEEILRIYGYNNVEFADKLHASVIIRQKPDPEKVQNLISDQLTAQGFVEIMNNSLTKSDYYSKSNDFNEALNVKLLNPLSNDLDVLRQSLVFGGLEVIAFNSNRKVPDLKLYEFGNIYQNKGTDGQLTGLDKYYQEKHLSLFITGRDKPENWNSANNAVDFFTLKGIVESILNKLGIDGKGLEIKEEKSGDFSQKLAYHFNGKYLAYVAEVDKNLLKAFDVKSKTYTADFNWDNIMASIPGSDMSYRPVPRYPAVRRDLALLVNNSVKFDELKETAFKTERKILKRVGLFDIYKGDKIAEGKKSYALSFILQDEDKTLTDKIIEKTMKRIQQAIEKEFDAELR